MDKSEYQVRETLDAIFRPLQQIQLGLIKELKKPFDPEKKRGISKETEESLHEVDVEPQVFFVPPVAASTSLSKPMDPMQGPNINTEPEERKSTLSNFQVKFEDLPEDCLSIIFRHLIFEQNSCQTLALFTVSKQFYKVCQKSSLLSEPFSILFDSSIEKQLIYSINKGSFLEEFF